MSRNREVIELVEELLDKWRDVKETSDDFTELTFADEIVDDLKEIHKCLVLI